MNYFSVASGQVLWDRVELERFESNSSRLKVTTMTHHHVEQSNSIFFANDAISPAYQRPFAVVAKYLDTAHVPTYRKQYANINIKMPGGKYLKRRESQTVGSLHRLTSRRPVTMLACGLCDSCLCATDSFSRSCLCDIKAQP